MKQILVFGLLALLSSACYADGLWYFGISPGAAVVDDDNFKGGGTARIYGGYQFTPYVGLETGSTLFDKFATKSDDNVYLRGYGQTFGVTGHLPVKRVVLNGGAGVFGWQMQARADNTTIGEDTGFSPYVHFGIDVMLPAHMVIGGGSTFYNDVSGADILTFSLLYGLRF